MEKFLRPEESSSLRFSAQQFKKNLRNISLIYGIRKFLKFLGPRIALFNNINKLYYYLLLTKSQYYQPLYNFAIINKKQPERLCLDRADAIYHEMKPWGQGQRILDIGCNLGFFSLYFADRGYKVSGIDNNRKHISICKILQKINRKEINFSVAEFSVDFLEHIQKNQYDMVFMFSVIHHVIAAHSLDFAQDLMAKLLEKIPTLFIELATDSEPTTSLWRSKVPSDELAVFAKCPHLKIEKLGSFSMNRNDVYRPLYKVSRC